jgi:hypothetical protein
MVKVELAAQQM